MKYTTIQYCMCYIKNTFENLSNNIFHIKEIKIIGKKDSWVYLKYLLIMTCYYFDVSWIAKKYDRMNNYYIKYHSPNKQFKTIVKSKLSRVHASLNIISHNDAYTHIRLNKNFTIIAKIEIGDVDILPLICDYIKYNQPITIKNILLINNIYYDDDTLITLSGYHKFNGYNVQMGVMDVLHVDIDKLTSDEYNGCKDMR